MILKGARQVGKTWLMKEFGKRYFKYTAYVNLDNNKHMKDVFEADYDIDRILMAVNIASGTRIVPGETLIIFDEIQENPKAIACVSFPVGKVYRLVKKILLYRRYAGSCQFFFGKIKEGARAKDFEIAIEWLQDCGLIKKVYNITKPAMPLKVCIEFSAFKLYLLSSKVH